MKIKQHRGAGSDLLTAFQVQPIRAPRLLSAHWQIRARSAAMTAPIAARGAFGLRSGRVFPGHHHHAVYDVALDAIRDEATQFKTEAG